MNKVSGVKSVDFRVVAKGHGVVNWNGSITLVGNDSKNVDNHMLPKLRGYSPLSGKIKEENGYKYRKGIEDINLSETPMYVSQNCIRHHLFKDQAYDLHYATTKNIEKVIASVTGLLRGFVIPSTQCKKTSPLLLEDFVDQLGNGNFEQFSTDKPNEEVGDKSGDGTVYKRPSDTLYSKTTFGDTEYVSYGSISIEHLQFVSLDPKYDRCAMQIKTGQGDEVARLITEFLESIKIDESLKPEAKFHENYCRIGAIFDEGEVGVLINDDGIEVLVNEMLSRVNELFIKQAKGYLYVDELEVDYNSSSKPMRIKKSLMNISSEKHEEFAKYYEAR